MKRDLSKLRSSRFRFLSLSLLAWRTELPARAKCSNTRRLVYLVHACDGESGTCLGGPPGASNWSRKESTRRTRTKTRREGGRRRLENRESSQVGERAGESERESERRWRRGEHYINAPICPLFQILFVFVNETMSLRGNCVIPEAPSAYMPPPPPPPLFCTPASPPVEVALNKLLRAGSWRDPSNPSSPACLL